MKHKHNEGFTLVEVLVAIVILGIFVVPTCSSLVLSLQMNNRADQMLKAQLAVSSALEEMKAEGIDETQVILAADGTGSYRSFDNVNVVIRQETGNPYYEVTVTSDTVESISVTTYIREMEPTTPTEGGG